MRESDEEKTLMVDNHSLLSPVPGFSRRKLIRSSPAKMGLSALEILASYSPGIVFVVLLMPNINGEKLCRIIRGNPRGP